MSELYRERAHDFVGSLSREFRGFSLEEYEKIGVVVLEVRKPPVHSHGQIASTAVSDAIDNFISLEIDFVKLLVMTERPVSEIKKSIMRLSRLGVVEKDVIGLVGLNILPVKCRNGRTSFMKARISSGGPEFVIVDSLKYCDEFKGKIDFLDFSIQEVRDALPFLRACNLERQFISKLVIEKTTVRHRSIDRNQTQKFRSKTKALVRWVSIHISDPSYLPLGTIG